MFRRQSAIAAVHMIGDDGSGRRLRRRRSQQHQCGEQQIKKPPQWAARFRHIFLRAADSSLHPEAGN